MSEAGDRLPLGNATCGSSYGNSPANFGEGLFCRLLNLGVQPAGLVRGVRTTSAGRPYCGIRARSLGGQPISLAAGPSVLPNLLTGILRRWKEGEVNCANCVFRNIGARRRLGREPAAKGGSCAWRRNSPFFPECKFRTQEVRGLTTPYRRFFTGCRHTLIPRPWQRARAELVALAGTAEGCQGTSRPLGPAPHEACQA